MRGKVLAILFCTLWLQQGFSQTKATFESCANNFKGAFSKGNAEIQKGMQDLRLCIIGQEFPSFNATSTTGKNFSLADFKNKVVLLNFWFVACAPCVAEMPLLNELNREYKDKDFLLLSFGRDDIKSIQEFMNDHKLEFEIFPAKDLIAHTFKLNFGYPTNFVLGKNGKIVEFKLGGPTDESGLANSKEEFRKVIDAELLK